RCEKQDLRLVKEGLGERGRPCARGAAGVWASAGRESGDAGGGGCSRFSTRCKQRSATLQGPREERPHPVRTAGRMRTLHPASGVDAAGGSAHCRSAVGGGSALTITTP